MSEFSRLKNKLLAEQVEDQIYHYILDTPLESGAKLPSQAAPPSALTSTTPASGWSRALWAWMKRPPSRPGPLWKRWSAVWASWWHWSSPSLPDRPSGACTPG